MQPMQLFDDITYLGHDESYVKWLSEQIPFGCGYIPFVDFDRELGWVFHTLLTPDGLKSEKRIAERFRSKKEAPAKAEAAIEASLALLLAEQGKAPRRQVACAAGIADIVTNEAVYEVKAVLSRDAMFSAVGQVLMYRAAINPALLAIVVGRSPDLSLSRFAKSLGVGVMDWGLTQ